MSKVGRTTMGGREKQREREDSVKVKHKLPGFLNSFGIRAEFDPDANPVKVTEMSQSNHFTHFNFSF